MRLVACNYREKRKRTCYAPPVAYWRLLALFALGLGMIALRACERYAQEYQTLPVVDWLEAHPPLSEAEDVPTAADLARGLAEAAPYLPLRSDAAPYSPDVAPPGRAQLTASGVRDAARLVLDSVPNAITPDEARVSLSLDVDVFYRSPRAAAWTELLTRELDIRDPQTGALQFRTGGPDEPDRVWVTVPREVVAHSGEATVLGHRGPVSFELKARLLRPTADDPRQLVELAGRAEALARTTTATWTAWLVHQPGVPAR